MLSASIKLVSLREARQVSLMTIVYWKASGNLVYLGKDDGSVEAALRAIGYIVRDMEAATDGLRSLMKTLHDQRTGTSSFCERGFDELVDFSALEVFFSLPWFR